MDTPRISDGKRSLVNWIRLNEQSRERARLWARVVFPTPGTSSIKRWPRASMQTTANSIACDLPLMTRSILSRLAWIFGVSYIGEGRGAKEKKIPREFTEKSSRRLEGGQFSDGSR